MLHLLFIDFLWERLEGIAPKPVKFLTVEMVEFVGGESEKKEKEPSLHAQSMDMGKGQTSKQQISVKVIDEKKCFNFHSYIYTPRGVVALLLLVFRTKRTFCCLKRHYLHWPWRRWASRHQPCCLRRLNRASSLLSIALSGSWDNLAKIKGPWEF